MADLPTMLSADSDDGSVTIGRNPAAAIRELSDSRKLRCPACGGPVVFKAGRVVASHFAHLSGAICAHPDSEPETKTHLAGKKLIAEWARASVPNALVTLEAPIEESGQRADVLMETDRGRVALEFQCADLSAREWLRRHRCYRAVGIRDLWLLGPSRLHLIERGIQCGDLEAAMSRYGAPLLFFDPEGELLRPGALARFRQSSRLIRGLATGSLSNRPLHNLPFPWRLLDWPLTSRISAAPPVRTNGEVANNGTDLEVPARDARLRRWIEERYKVNPDGMSCLFNIPTFGEEVFACSPRLWKAAVYYRFIDRRTGQTWRMAEVQTWSWRYLPFEFDNEMLVRRALRAYEDILAAAGILGTEVGGCIPTLVEADLNTLANAPDPVAVDRMAAYRRSLLWKDI